MGKFSDFLKKRAANSFKKSVKSSPVYKKIKIYILGGVSAFFLTFITYMLLPILIVSLVCSMIGDISVYEQECPELVRCYLQSNFEEFEKQIRSYCDDPQFESLIYTLEFDSAYTKMVFGGDAAYTKEERKGIIDTLKKDNVAGSMVSGNGKIESVLSDILKYQKQGVSMDKIFINDEYLEGYSSSSGVDFSKKTKKGGDKQDDDIAIPFKQWVNSSFYNTAFYYWYNALNETDYLNDFSSKNSRFEKGQYDSTKGNNVLRYGASPIVSTKGAPYGYANYDPLLLSGVKDFNKSDSVMYLKYGPLAVSTMYSYGGILDLMYSGKYHENNKYKTSKPSLKSDKIFIEKSILANKQVINDGVFAKMYKIIKNGDWSGMWSNTSSLQNVLNQFNKKYGDTNFKEYYLVADASKIEPLDGSLPKVELSNGMKGFKTWLEYSKKGKEKDKNFYKYIALSENDKRIQSYALRENSINSAIEKIKDNFATYIASELYYVFPSRQVVKDYFMGEDGKGHGPTKQDKVLFLERAFYAMATGSSLDLTLDQSWTISGGKVYNNFTEKQVGTLGVKNFYLTDIKLTGAKSGSALGVTGGDFTPFGDDNNTFESYKNWRLSQSDGNKYNARIAYYDAKIKIELDNGKTKEFDVTLSLTKDSNELYIDYSQSKKKIGEFVGKDINWNKTYYKNVASTETGKKALENLVIKFDKKDTTLVLNSYLKGEDENYYNPVNLKKYINEVQSDQKIKDKGLPDLVSGYAKNKDGQGMKVEFKYRDSSFLYWDKNVQKDEKGNIKSVNYSISFHLVDVSKYNDDDGEYRVAYGFETEGAVDQADALLEYYNSNKTLDGVSEHVDFSQLIIHEGGTEDKSGQYVTDEDDFAKFVMKMTFAEENRSMNYADFHKAPNEAAYTAGILQWYSDNARDLIQKIIKADKDTAKSKLGDDLYSKLMKKQSWGNLGFTSSEVTRIKKLLGTKASKKVQDAVALSYVKGYIKEVRKLGYENLQVIAYLADAYNQSPAAVKIRVTGKVRAKYGSVKKFEKQEGSKALEVIRDFCLADVYIDSGGVQRGIGVQVGRRKRVYEYIKNNLKVDQTGISQYAFPLDGKSDYTVSRGYGKDGLQAGEDFHYGVDFAAPKGTRVYAAKGGTVEFAGFGKAGSGYGGYGNVVAIKHNDGYVSFYAHLKDIKSGIKKGAKVKIGARIGSVGSTGNSTGNHLHFELRKNGERHNCIDPLSVMTFPAGTNFATHNLKKYYNNKGAISASWALYKVGANYSQKNRATGLNGNSFDCSSLVYYAWLSAGVKLCGKDSPPTSRDEFSWCKKNWKSVKRTATLQQGDLLFYDFNVDGRIDHVSIYVGDNSVVEGVGDSAGICKRNVNLGQYLKGIYRIK